MPGPPFSDRAVSFTLAPGMSQVDVAEADHPHRGRLDHRYPVTSGIHDGLPKARTGQRLALMLVICHQPAGSGLAAVENRGDQLVAERSGKAKLCDRQILR